MCHVKHSLIAASFLLLTACASDQEIAQADYDTCANLGGDMQTCMLTLAQMRQARQLQALQMLSDHNAALTARAPQIWRDYSNARDPLYRSW